MKLVIIFGPGAVGKMTVGQELEKLTKFKLFHNHKSIEFIIDVLGEYNSEAVLRLRKLIFEEFLKTSNEGIIFTFMWAFNMQDDWDLINGYYELFTNERASVYFVELEASQKIRLERNKTENRINNKPSKKDVNLSQTRLMGEDAKNRLNSCDGEITYENYIKINNENLTASEVAKMIVEKFNF